MRDNARDFHATPGPGKDPEAKANPGFDFVYVLPVNQRFGLTLSGGYSKTYSDQEQIDTTWRGVRTATNGTTFPNTTPDRPYLTSLYDRTNPKMMRRTGASITFDYRLSASDQLSLNFIYARNHLVQMAHTITFNVTQVPAGQFALDWTHGAVGQGNVTIDNISSFNDNHTHMPTLTWRHRGLNWEANAGLAHSQAEAYSYGGPGGAFRTALAQRQGLTLSFDGFNGLKPARITATDGATGTAVDLYDINSYAMRTAGDNLVRSSDLKRTAYFNVTRRYGTEVPISLKSGLDVRQAVRGQRNSSLTLTYVGADGRTSTTPTSGDDQASPFLDPSNSLRAAPFGFPRWQRLSVYKLWDYFRANPGRFTRDENTDYRNSITNSKRTEEIVSAAYLRLDTAILSGRLKLTGGVRAEQVNISAEGPLTDPTGNYQRNAKGDVILGSNGRPLTIASDALTISKLTYRDRGTLVDKEYFRLFPSLNTSFNLKDNFILRAAHYYSIGRPNFNQYSGGLTLPDIESAPSASNRITVNNAGIKPWTARSTSARLEYYFAGVGQVSISGFVRDFSNFFGSTATPATPAFLALYGLDPAIYGSYDVVTQQNLTSALRMSGWTFSYKQALTFLPTWARGVQVFANCTEQHLQGDESAKGNLQTFFPDGELGASLNRPAFNLRTNFSYRGKRRNGLITGLSIDPGTYNWNQSKLQIDVLGEYRLGKELSLFANLRNVNTALDEDIQNYGPQTPAYAKVQHLGDLGALWTIGVKGTF
jgi:TonB-dependent receptor